MSKTMDLATVNDMSRSDFMAAFGDIFEHSAWIAERAFDGRPFADITELHKKMVAVVNQATKEEKLGLLRAHPELAGREAQAGSLTDASTSEQASVGFNALSKDEIDRIAKLNAEYQSRFGFPFIIAVRRSTKNDIFRQWERRLKNTPVEEMTAGLDQVYVIARLRLDSLLNKKEKAMNDSPTGKLSTHVLDTANGCPAAGVRIELFRRDDDGDYQLIKTVRTNKDGRTDELMLDKDSISVGHYQLIFHIGSHFSRIAGLSAEQAKNTFLGEVPVRFAISDATENYHVPLVASPWSYSTYRGS